MAKKSFVLYNDQKEIIDELSDEQAGKLLKAIYEYNINKKITLTGTLKVIFIPFKNSFDRDEEKWEEISKQRSEAGKRHTGNQYTRQKNGTTVPICSKKWNKMEQNGTNGTVSVSASVSDSVSVNVNDSVCVNNTQSKNTPDTHDTVFQFSLSVFQDYDQNDLKKSCKKFYSYYKEKDWKGVNDWKEKLQMWIDNDIDLGKVKLTQNQEQYVDEAGFEHKNGRRIL